MTKEECAKVLAVKYVLDYNTFRRSERLKEDLLRIRMRYQVGENEDDEFNTLFERYCNELRDRRDNIPRWAKLLMAERYALNV